MIKDQLVKIAGIPEELILIECFCDCQDAVASFNSSKQHQKGGRVQIDAAKDMRCWKGRRFILSSG